MVNYNSGMKDPDTNTTYSRMKFTVDAVNAAIQDIMDMNENTRVAVVAFSNDAQVLLPLDHYTQAKDSSGNAYPYFSLNKTTPLSQNAQQNSYPLLTTRAVNSNGDAVNTGTIRVYGGTNIQQGIYTGASVLTDVNNQATVTVNGMEVQRVPAVVLLSDGAPSYSSASDDWWAPDPDDGLLSTGGSNNDYYYGNGMKAMMVGAYMRQAINTKYGVTDETSDYAVTFHTIGMGISELTGDAKNLANITLNPASNWNNTDTMASNIRSKWSEYTQENNRSISVQVTSGYWGNDTLYHPSTNDIDSINDWVDQYHSANSAEEIADVFADFSFKIVPSDQNPDADPISEKEVSNDANGNVVFEDGVVYTAPGKYLYSVYEVTDKQLPGVNYDSTHYTICVDVTDPEHNGKLTADVTITAVNGDKETEVNSITFENGYNPEDATAIISGDKSFIDVTTSKDKTMTAGQFTFKLTGKDGAPMPENTTAENSASGHFAFDEITYTRPGTYEYEISEVSDGGLAGVSYDKSVYKVVVVVEDVASEDVSDQEEDQDADQEENQEENQEDVDTSEESDVSVEDAVLEESTEEIVSAENTDSSEISVIAEDDQDTEDQDTEDKADEEDADTNEADTDGYGMLKATVTYYDADGDKVNAVEFHNTYKPAPVTDVEVKGTKKLTGRNLKDGEFTFQLVDSDNHVVSKDTNDEDGIFVLTIDEIDAVGEYAYAVQEVKTDAAGITYDTTVYTVMVKVTDENAKLKADVTYYADQEEVDKLVVTNGYEPDETEVQLGAVKNLEGRDLEAGEFEFELKDGSGEVISTAVNGKDGVITFDAITYDSEGVYKYTISEKQGTLENVTYDKTVYKVTVTVTDDQEGHLVAKVDYDGETPVFTNTYTGVTPTPTPSESATPTPTPTPTPDGSSGTTVKTGDLANIAGFVGIAVAALGVIALVLYYFRRRTNK